MFVSSSHKSSRRFFNAIRLLLAWLVLFSHSFALGGFPGGGFPLDGRGISWGSFAVGIFFAISGWFITTSSFRSDFREFVVARLLRIFPALFVVLIFTALVFYPTMVRISGGVAIDINQGAEYIVHNLFLPTNLKWDIAGQPLGVPYSGSINGSLWTLPLEIKAYAIAGFLALLFRSRRSRFIVFPIATVIFFITSMLHSSGVNGFWNSIFPGPQAELFAIFFAVSISKKGK
jgi:peptidoglycan/LPS O-acetylase OafA/YrhL